MENNHKPAAFMIADNFALDLLNSIATPNNTEFEWLSNGSELLDWLQQAKLISAQDLDYLRRPELGSNCDKIAAKVRELRDWLRQFIINHAGRALQISDIYELDIVNRILFTDNNYRQIIFQEQKITAINNNSVLKWQRNRHKQKVENLLLIIAEIIGDLICSVDFELIKNCEGPSCSLWFYDVSKNHSRRWCTMSVCGNRAKAALHRAKRKTLR